MTIQVALLNDYQQIALKLAPWETLGPAVSVQAFSVKFADENEAVAKLKEFDIVMAMRERQPFPRSLLARLPRLKMYLADAPKGVMNPEVLPKYRRP